MESKCVFHNKNFNLLIVSKIISLFGTEFQNFALSLYVLKTTGSGLKFASVLSLSVFFKVVFGLWGGVIVDRVNRKRLVVLLDMLCGTLLLLMYVISRFQVIIMLHIYLIVIILSAISAIYQPAVGTIFPSILNKEQLGAANSYNQFLTTIITLIAPILAAASFSQIGIGLVFLINGFSFLVSSFMEIRMKIPSQFQEKRREKSSFRSDFKEGFKILGNLPAVWSVLLIGAIINFFISPILGVGYPYVIKVVLKQSDMVYGIIEAISIGGSLFGILIFKFLEKKISLKKNNFIACLVIALSVLIIGIAISPIVLSRSIAISTIIIGFLAFIIGTEIVITTITIITIKQRIVPNEYLGRINAINSTIVMCFIPLGQMLYGFMSEYIPIYIYTIISAAIVLGALSVFYVKFVAENNKVYPESPVNQEEAI